MPEFRLISTKYIIISYHYRLNFDLSKCINTATNTITKNEKFGCEILWIALQSLQILYTANSIKIVFPKA